MEAMQSILIHDFFPNLLLDTGSMTLSPIRVTPPKNLLVKRMCAHPSSWIHHGVESYVLEDESIVGVSSARLSSRNCSPSFCPLDGFLSLFSWTSFLGCNRRRIAAAVAAAAAAAFEEAGIFPLCGGNGFPMHARRFDLRFNFVRIL